MGVGQGQPQQQQEQPQQQAVAKERLNPAVQQQLNLESVKTRALSLYKAITRILEDFELIARTNSVPKWLVSPINKHFEFTHCNINFVEFINASELRTMLIVNI